MSSVVPAETVTKLDKRCETLSDLRVTSGASGNEESEARVIYLNANKSDYAPQLIDRKHRLPFVTMTIYMNTTQSDDSAFPSQVITMPTQDRVLVDTGSMFSMLRKTYTYLLGKGMDKFHETSLSRYKFLAANGTPITIYGSVAVIISLPTTEKDNRAYAHDFFVADISDNIIGYDF